VADEVVLELAGRELRIASPDTVFFSEPRETRLDLARYYLAIADDDPGAQASFGF
jgi:DNA primase